MLELILAATAIFSLLRNYEGFMTTGDSNKLFSRVLTYRLKSVTIIKVQVTLSDV